MTTNLKSYRTYKPSGIPWLGNIPPHWDVRRGKALLSPVDIRSDTGGEELLTVSARRGVVPRKSASVTMFKAESYVGYKLCWPGDLVINSLWAWAHGLGVSQHYGIVSSAYGVYRPLPKAHARFIHLLVRSVPFQWELQVRSKGIWVSRLQLTDKAFLGAPFPLPSLPEQTAIVRYLDHVDERIRRYLSGKQELIRLLEEEKQAVINRAVTGQVDVCTGQPYPAYKPSGVEWLGDVPAHWEMRRLRHLVKGKLTYGANAAAEYTDPDWPRYLRITDFDQDGVLKSNTFRSLPPEVARDYLVQPGDLLLARSGATVGKAFLVPVGVGEACYAGYLIRARPHRALIEPYFLFSFTQSTGFTRWKNSTCIVSTIENISAEKYADLHVPCPPLSEQSQIILYLDKATADIDTIMSSARRQIELLQEYRTRLIADVVTGQLDVREAARMPEVDSLEIDPGLAREQKEVAS